MSTTQIPVLDENNKFLSYTNSAKARILLKQGKAVVFRQSDPFIIRLKGDGELKMKNRRSNVMGGMITNFTDYFKEEREVYVQNLGNTQISLLFPSSFGTDVSVVIPKTKKPYNLTQRVPFASIKASLDFRKIINRRPPLLRLMTEEEFEEYYEQLATRNNTTFEQELSSAIEIQDKLMNHIPITKQTDAQIKESETKLEEKVEELQAASQPHPQVVGLCARADKDQGANRISADDFIEELEGLEAQGVLKAEDWEFVQTKGVYKQVKNFAAKELEALTAPDDEDN